jgi:WS/DGAT/MGAT family acyltransferase
VGERTVPEVSGWSERLTALDAAFLDIEEETAPMHVGSVSLFQGRPPSPGALAALIASRLDRVPRYAQKLAVVPFGVGRPVWVDDFDLDLDRHVLRARLERPGGMAELGRFAADLFSKPLDRAKPMWEYWVVEGVGRGTFAVVSKTHHCMIDGVSGVDLASILMETEKGAKAPGRAAPWTPRPSPWAGSMVAGALREQLLRPFELARESLTPGTEGRRALEEIVGGLRPLAGISRLGPAPASPLNRPVGRGRVFEMVSVGLDDVKGVRAALGGTVNDVVLAVVAGALRALLLGRGERVDGPLRVMVPVSVRPPEARGTLGNQVAAVFCPLPVHLDDPVARLRAVSESMRGLKESRQAVGAMALTRLGNLAPPPLAALATRLQSGSPWFNLVVTNVPGPQVPLYLLGRKLLGCHPMVPLTTRTTISVALLSYDGSIDIGLLGDAGHAADLPELGRQVSSALAELSRAAMAALAATAATASTVARRRPARRS